MSMKEKSPMSRRDFLKLAGLSGAVTLPVIGQMDASSAGSEASPPAGMRHINVPDLPCNARQGPVAYEPDPIRESEITETITTDVVIVGGGISGICAAHAALDAGAEVILLEKMTKGAGRAERMACLDSQLLRDAGVENDKIEYVDELLRCGDYRNDPKMAWLFANRSGEAADWLANISAELGRPMMVMPPDKWDGFYRNQVSEIMYIPMPPWPEDAMLRPGYQFLVMVPLLTENAIEKGLDARFETPVARLEKDASGRVVAAVARNADGTATRFVGRRGIILATGGYEYNPDMLKQYCRPEEITTTSWWSPCSGTTGDGHMMGLEMGAAMDPGPHTVMSFKLGTPAAFWSMPFFSFIMFGINVNQNGERFGNEALPEDMVAHQIQRQPGNGLNVWCIGDDKFLGHIPLFGPREAALARIPEYEERGWLVQADTIPDLAEKIGVPADKLEATLDRYNGFFELGRDQDFGKSLDIGFMELPVPDITQPPYYALRHLACNLVTVSGLIIDDQTRVLDTDGQVIPGLYAVGNASGGLFSGTYARHISGLSIGRAVTWGRVAGQVAAADTSAEGA